ncbi:MAG: alpha/beta hydrolase [Oscillospiraceae bacterium]|nr:alpha/beta hydrolase [Oscillospiraceae bacterium]
MNLSELNVAEEWAYYNKMAPTKIYNINGGDLKYRYYKKENAKATIVVLAGGSGLADGFFLFLRSLMDKYSLITLPYPLFCRNNDETAEAIACLIRYLKAENVYFWGQSYGGLLSQIIAKKHPDVVSGLLLTSTASFSTDLTFSGMKCIVNMINEEKEEKRIKKYKRMPVKIAMAMFPLMFKPHLKGDKKAYKTIKDLIKILEPELSREHFIHMTRLLGDLRNHFGLYKKEDFEYLSGKVLIIEPTDDKTFTDDIKNALFNMMSEPKIISKVEGGHLAIMFNPDEYIKLIDDFIT